MRICKKKRSLKETILHNVIFYFHVSIIDNVWHKKKELMEELNGLRKCIGAAGIIFLMVEISNNNDTVDYTNRT